MTIEVKNQTAFINEAYCIGCTKCIPVCPVDAILGASKQLHVVVQQDCTGCENCVIACPVDCIEMKPIERSPEDLNQKIDYCQTLADKKSDRLEKNIQIKKSQVDTIVAQDSYDQAIQDAIARSKAKRAQQKQLWHIS